MSKLVQTGQRSMQKEKKSAKQNLKSTPKGVKKLLVSVKVRAESIYSEDHPAMKTVTTILLRLIIVVGFVLVVAAFIVGGAAGQVEKIIRLLLFWLIQS